MCQLKEMTYPIQIQYTDYTCIQPAVFPPYIRVIQKTLKKYIQGHNVYITDNGARSGRNLTKIKKLIFTIDTFKQIIFKS